MTSIFPETSRHDPAIHVPSVGVARRAALAHGPLIPARLPGWCRSRRFHTADFLVVLSDLIVRVIPTEYERPPATRTSGPTGEPDSRVRFRILEVLKGVETLAGDCACPRISSIATISTIDLCRTDFVRPGGRARQLFCQLLSPRRAIPADVETTRVRARTRSTGSSLAPVNEQLRSRKRRLDRVGSHSGSAQPTRHRRTWSPRD